MPTPEEVAEMAADLLDARALLREMQAWCRWMVVVGGDCASGRRPVNPSPNQWRIIEALADGRLPGGSDAEGE